MAVEQIRNKWCNSKHFAIAVLLFYIFLGFLCVSVPAFVVLLAGISISLFGFFLKIERHRVVWTIGVIIVIFIAKGIVWLVNAEKYVYGEDGATGYITKYNAQIMLDSSGKPLVTETYESNRLIDPNPPYGKKTKIVTETGATTIIHNTRRGMLVYELMYNPFYIFEQKIDPCNRRPYDDEYRTAFDVRDGHDIQTIHIYVSVPNVIRFKSIQHFDLINASRLLYKANYNKNDNTYSFKTDNLRCHIHCRYLILDSKYLHYALTPFIFLDSIPDLDLVLIGFIIMSLIGYIIDMPRVINKRNRTLVEA